MAIKNLDWQPACLDRVVIHTTRSLYSIHVCTEAFCARVDKPAGRAKRTLGAQKNSIRVPHCLRSPHLSCPALAQHLCRFACVRFGRFSVCVRLGLRVLEVSPLSRTPCSPPFPPHPTPLPPPVRSVRCRARFGFGRFGFGLGSVGVPSFRSGWTSLHTALQNRGTEGSFLIRGWSSPAPPPGALLISNSWRN